MMIVYTLLAIAWLCCGIFCLYHMDFSTDMASGFTGIVIMVSMVILVLIIGPLMLREIIRHNYPPTK